MDKESQGKEAVPVEANQSHAEMDRYILAVTERFFAMKDLLSMHILTPLFYGKGAMEKCPEPYRAQVYELIKEAEAVRREGELCCTEITEKQSEAIQRLGDLEEHGIKAPATAKPLFMVIHELFNETLRLGALVAQAISILKDLTHTLELAGNKNKDFEDIAERLKKDMAEMHKTLLETMLDTSAKITDHDARTTAEHREHDTKLEGVPPLVGAARDADARGIEAAEDWLDKLDLTEKHRKVYRQYRRGKTQEQIAAALKCDVSTIRRYSKRINDAFRAAGMVNPIVWGHKKSRAEVATKAAWAGGVTYPDDPDDDGAGREE